MAPQQDTELMETHTQCNWRAKCLQPEPSTAVNEKWEDLRKLLRDYEMQDGTVQMQQKNTVFYYRKSRETPAKVGSQQKKTLDHTDRPAEECQES